MNFKSYILIFTIIYFCCSSGNVKTIHTIEEALDELSDIDKDTLVVFDIDKTLITPQDPVFNFDEIIYDKIEAHYNKTQDLEYYQKIANIVVQRQSILVENIIPELIQNIQKTKVKTIALTNVKTLATRIIPDMAKLRFGVLKEFGIDFSNSFEQEHLILDKLPQYQTTYPEFHMGILMTNSIEKGLVLVEFLKQLNWTPKKVIFFDDILENVISVKTHLKNWNNSIVFTGYHYIKCGDIVMGKKSINPKVFNCQINYLIKKGIWIPTDKFYYFFKDLSH